MNTFNREKCAQRNRIAASRRVDAFPFQFIRSVPAGFSPVTARGVLPGSDEEALERINERLPDGASPLTLSDIYIHYLKAANSNYIDDRYMFLDNSTLRNIAADANQGFAFMNSHRTGGWSGGPAELPMGQSFAGRYEVHKDESGKLFQAAIVGMYMLSGIHPNGANSPSTDDMHRMIDGGTIKDCSVGLNGGKRVCDVCGNELYEYDRESERYLCEHIPGTTRKMTDDEQEAQRSRGVTDGAASYSLVDAHCGEVSAVYDGAIPGAGFGKYSLMRDELLPVYQLQAKTAYHQLWKGGPMEQEVDEGAIERVLRRFGLRPQPTPSTPELIAAGTVNLVPSPREVQLQKELEATKAAHQQMLADMAAQNAKAFLSRLVQERKALPFQAEDAALLHQQIALWQQSNPAQLTNHAGTVCSPLALFETVLLSTEPHRLTESLLPAGLPTGARVLPGATSKDSELDALEGSVIGYAKERNGLTANGGDVRGPKFRRGGN